MTHSVNLIGGPFDQSVTLNSSEFESGTVKLIDSREVELNCGPKTTTRRVGRYQKRLHQPHIWDWKGWYRQ